MNYSKKEELIKEFKTATKNKDFKPTYDQTYGNKYAGELTYLHYVFYRMLINKSIEKTTHNIESAKYKFRKLQLLSFIKDIGNELTVMQCNEGLSYEVYQSDIECIFSSLNEIMPSLTKEDVIFVVNKYYLTHE